MGLLDDAIREHLELKRQHGADPTEVARQEREAFGSGRVAPPPDDDAADAAPDLPDAPPTTADAAPPAHEPPLPDAIPEPPVEALPPSETGGAVSMSRGPELEPEDDLDWSDPVPLNPPADDPRAAAPDDAGPSEDVLEETPEFLQETPEHDRLWFEQRPPKDFDF